MYTFTYLLCHANQTNNFDTVQLLLGGIQSIFISMHDSFDTLLKTVYAPSYWYVTEIGFVQEPTLEKVCFLMAVDILRSKDRPIKK